MAGIWEKTFLKNGEMTGVLMKQLECAKQKKLPRTDWKYLVNDSGGISLNYQRKSPEAEGHVELQVKGHREQYMELYTGQVYTCY